MPTPLPVIPGVYRCALKWRNSDNGQTAVNVIHILNLGAGNLASDVMTAMDSTTDTGMWFVVHSHASVFEVDITKLDGTSATQTFAPATPANWTGNGGTGDFIPAVASLVKLQTPNRGRQNRGRVYLPFTAEGQVSDGSITPSTAPSTVLWNDFRADLEEQAPNPMHLVVASYDRKHAGAGAHATITTNAQVEQVLATQRRRQGRLR